MRVLLLALALVAACFWSRDVAASVSPSTVTMWGTGACRTGDPASAVQCQQGGTNIEVDNCSISGSEATCQIYFLGPRASNGSRDGPYVAFADASGNGSACPSNSTANSSGTCDCGSGYMDASLGTACALVTTNCKAQAQFASGNVYHTAGAIGNVICYAGCSLQAGIVGTDTSGSYYGGTFTSLGATCGSSASAPTPDASSPSGAAPGALMPGYCPGSVNGVAVPGGVPCQSTTTTQTTSMQPGVPTPTSSASAASDATNGTSTSTSTTCTNGSCNTTTTTTTTTGVGGAGGGTTTTGSSTSTQPESSFCQSNPGDAQCSSAFSGTCTGFVCKGDAVSCATAQIEYESTCMFAASPSAATVSKYSLLAAQAGGQATGSFVDSHSIASALPSAPGAGAGVADVAVSFGSGTTAMSLSMPVGTYLAPHFAVIRGVIVAFGYLAFVLIVFVRK